MAMALESGQAKCLIAAGLGSADVEELLAARPQDCREFAADLKRYSDFWAKSARLLGRLPAKPRRNPAEQAAAAELQNSAQQARIRYLRQYVQELYDTLTARRTRFVRIEDMVRLAGREYPGLLPSEQQIAGEAGLLQRDKDGLEIDQGLFVAAILEDQRCGTHLCHAMLLPRPEAFSLLTQFRRDGRVVLAGAS